jgi:hypothetical protein
VRKSSCASPRIRERSDKPGVTLCLRSSDEPSSIVRSSKGGVNTTRVAVQSTIACRVRIPPLGSRALRCVCKLSFNNDSCKITPDSACRSRVMSAFQLPPGRSSQARSSFALISSCWLLQPHRRPQRWRGRSVRLVPHLGGRLIYVAIFVWGALLPAQPAAARGAHRPLTCAIIASVPRTRPRLAAPARTCSRAPCLT